MSGWYWVRLDEMHPFIPVKYNAVGEAWFINGQWFKDEEIFEIDERRILRKEN